MGTRMVTGARRSRYTTGSPLSFGEFDMSMSFRPSNDDISSARLSPCWATWCSNTPPNSTLFLPQAETSKPMATPQYPVAQELRRNEDGKLLSLYRHSHTGLRVVRYSAMALKALDQRLANSSSAPNGSSQPSRPPAAAAGQADASPMPSSPPKATHETDEPVGDVDIGSAKGKAREDSIR